MLLSRLTPPVYSIPLFHPQFDGRIAWNATDPKGEIIVEVQMAEKRRGVRRCCDIERIKVVTISLRMRNTDFPLNFYHPEFPAAVHTEILAQMALKRTKKVIDEMLRM